MDKKTKSIDFAGEKLTLSSGHLAMQATSSVLAEYGETVVFVSVVAQPVTVDLGYFPLQVEYEERLYAGGKIKGSKWVKRSGRPSDEEILTARLIDRSIRPLFPEGYSNEVQVIINVMSVDGVHQPDMVAAVATSAALSISNIPWNGPIGALRLGRVNGEFLSNPTNMQMELSDLDLIVSSTKKAVVMIEAGAHEVAEKDISDAVEHAHKEATKLIEFIDDFASLFKVKKEVVDELEVDKKILAKVDKIANKDFGKVAEKMATKEMQYADFDRLKQSFVDEFEGEDDKKQAKLAFDKLFYEYLRKMLLSGKRPDGRKPDELRNLSAEVGILPRTHGTGLFQRGQTQALSVATLANTSYEQLIETAEGEVSKKYIHHYAMPPYSTGEVGRVGSPKRREIGHGALAERAIEPMLPSEGEFPYTVQVVTDILSSNGSTSMAAVCGSTLALMDAGVPLKRPVAGIAMGAVIKDESKFNILTDIVGLEDGNGDMDFKVAGTKNGITALQLDVKTLDLTPHILAQALDQAKKARLEILEVIEKTIKEPRKALSKYAPKILTVKIDVDKIGELIGPGGKNIKKIIEVSGAEVNVADDGTVSVSSSDDEACKKAIEMVEAVSKEILKDELYDGIVTRAEPYGVFVKIIGDKEGLVHVSDMSEEFVKNPEDIAKLGDNVKIRVKDVDQRGRLSFSMVLDPSKEKKRDNNFSDRRNDRPRSGFGDRRNQRPQHPRGRFDPRKPRDISDRPSGGPHFPASRLMDLDEKKR